MHSVWRQNKRLCTAWNFPHKSWHLRNHFLYEVCANIRCDMYASKKMLFSVLKKSNSTSIMLKEKSYKFVTITTSIYWLKIVFTKFGLLEVGEPIFFKIFYTFVCTFLLMDDVTSMRLVGSLMALTHSILINLFIKVELNTFFTYLPR